MTQGNLNELPVATLRNVGKAFAVGSDEEIEEANKKTLLAMITEAGVDWDQYAKMFLVEPEPVVDEPKTNTGVVTTQQMEVPVVEVEERVIVTQEQFPVLKPNAEYLVKMERENPYFEFAVNGKIHKFTKDHPYVLMDAADADIVLQEDGFRQARPSELQEYYS